MRGLIQFSLAAKTAIRCIYEIHCLNTDVVQVYKHDFELGFPSDRSQQEEDYAVDFFDLFGA